MSLYSGLFKSLRGASNRRLLEWRNCRSLSTPASDFAKPDTLEQKGPQPDTDDEHGKMVSEGGGSVSSYGEAKDDAKKKSAGVVEGIKQQAEKEMNTARDMVKDMPQKATETTHELKETVAVAGEALKRDVEKLAEKAGIRDRKPGDLENE